jgi:alkanesulfonate monooxygenase SsuD/methylene tetrahydromethanopterin reductase-like flavin-dependent oxidoreductase (luciferase family)
MRLGIKPGQLGWTFDQLVESWQAAEDAGFDLVSCFDHLTTAPDVEGPAWDAPSLLVAMAGVTSRITLAVDVLNVSLRNPVVLASQIAVAQAASGGRVQVGLGAGSPHLAKFDHGAIGLTFPPHRDRVELLDACCRVLPRLWAGEEVTEPSLGMEGASLGPVAIDAPRLVVGGQSDAVLEIAVRHADGWNVGSRDVEGCSEAAQRLRDMEDRLGRERHIELIAQQFVRNVDLSRAREIVRRLGDAGVGTVVFVLDEEREPNWVRRVADAVLGG